MTFVYLVAHFFEEKKNSSKLRNILRYFFPTLQDFVYQNAGVEEVLYYSKAYKQSFS